MMRQVFRQMIRQGLMICAAVVATLFATSSMAAPILNKVQSKVGSLDPAKVGDTASGESAGLIFEMLYEFDYLARPYRLNPAAAAELPEISADGRTYTIRLRQDSHYHDDPCFPDGKGRVVTAHDFVFGWKRLVDRKTGSAGAWVVEDIIEGMKSFAEASAGSAPTDYTRPVSGLKALDDFTLQVTLVKPFNQFQWFMALPYMAPVPPEAIAHYGLIDEHPVGAGAYYLESWRRNYAMVFRRNTLWHGWDVVDFTADEIPFEEIHYLVINDASTQWLAFLRGELDFLAQVSRDNWDVVIDPSKGLTPELKARGISLFSSPTLKTYYIGLNMDDPVLGNNKPLRQALNAAFNTESWISFYKHRVKALTTPSPPHLKGALNTPYPYAYNIPKAMKLLEEAGYPGGRDPKTGRRLTLSLDLGNSSQDIKESAELFASFMDQVGIEVKILSNQWPNFLRKVSERKSQMFLIGWVGDYPDIENFMQVFLSRNQSPGPNRCNYINPELDALYEEAVATRDDARQVACWERMQEIIREDSPWIFLHYSIDYALTQKRLRNFVPHDFPYGMECHWRVRRGD